MLGPVGKLASRILTERMGYQIYRPTQHERALMRSPWEDWFSTNPELFAQIYQGNRETLSGVSNWVDPASLPNSLWRYGVPEQWEAGRLGIGCTGLNEIEPEVTYTDLIAFIASHIEPLSYLEIGVSVGKNFLQMVERFPDAEIIGLDVEDINPVLAARFDRIETVSRSERTYPVESLAGRASVHLTEYRLHRSNGRTVTYVKGDQYSPDTWALLKGRRFNCIFSDGVHSPRALRDEYRQFAANDLLDFSGRFAIYWDDLVDIGMQDAFNEIADELPGWHGLHWIHGTYGHKRLNGLAANFRL